MKKFIALVAFSLLLAGCGEAAAPVATPTPTLGNGLCNPSCSADTSPVPTQVATPLEPTQAPIPTTIPTPTTIVSDVKQNIANAIQADGDTVTYCFIIDKPPTITVAGQAVDVSMDDSSAVNIDVERAKHAFLIWKETHGQRTVHSHKLLHTFKCCYKTNMVNKVLEI